MKMEYTHIDEFIKANSENILRDIARLVAIPSEEGCPAPGAPFGAGPRAALDMALTICKENDLYTQNALGYIGWAEIPGEDTSKYLATITHVDVVPAGNGWEADPYKVRMKDGWLLGRGIMDDKGPTILCIYALKYLKERHEKLKYPIRALFGANEETDMGDITYYKEHFPMPAFCFTPDAEFPVCNGEKGIYECSLVSEPLQGKILAFSGGTASNAVPDYAEALIDAPENAFVRMEHITLEPDGNGHTWVRGHGVSAHASTPESGRNAIGLVIGCLLKSDVCTEKENVCLRALHKLHADTDGTTLGLYAKDDYFSPLTVVGGVISMQEGVITQSVDCRYPTSITAKEISLILQTACGNALTVTNPGAEEPFYISADAPAIRVLTETYNSVCGEKKEPFTIGGGTYARHFPMAVSFGPERPDIPLPSFVGPIHGANEGAQWEKLLQALKIYILALERLEELEF